ncbi:MAG: DUF3108 domain-containing protein [Siculibacillus sp.]|nr:DUF3108 domain-containing protein [Siculibacillus sp.]
MSLRLAVPAALLCLFAASAAAEAAPARAALPAAQQPQTRLRYSISLAGLPVAHAGMTLAATADHYSSQIAWRTSGLADVLAGARGDAAASGQLGPRRPIPATYTLASGEGRKAAKVMLAMAGGTVKAAETQPPSRETPDLVPLQPRHRVDVLDPVSAVLMPARGGDADGGDLCRRTLPIFDGWTRYDIRLTPKTTLPNRRPGVTGPIVVCAARYVPVAGHRSQHRTTRFMEANEDLSVSFGRLEKADVWVPLEVSVRTMVGTAVVSIDSITTTGYDKTVVGR